MSIVLVLSDYVTSWQSYFGGTDGGPQTNPLTLAVIVLATAATFQQRPLKPQTRLEATLWIAVIAVLALFPVSRTLCELAWPGRNLGETGWNTAFALSAIAASQLVRRRSINPALALCLFGIGVTAIAINGYLLSQENFFGNMSPTTTLGVFSLGIANLMRFSRTHYLRLILRDDAPGRLLRSQLTVWIIMFLTTPLILRPDMVHVRAMLPVTHTAEMAFILLTFVYFGGRFAKLLYQERRSREKLQFDVAHDALTGAATRAQAISAFQGTQGNIPLGVIMVDLDHFKDINDSYGHAAGDEVLKQAVKTLRRQLRTSDLVARWGGEEFLILARVPNHDALVSLADRLRKALHGLS